MGQFGGRPRGWAKRIVVVGIALVASGIGVAWADSPLPPVPGGGPGVPEIDGASMANAVTALFGGLMLWNARRGRRS